mmetsp:Transcript_37629/g.55265  ORF Transcript_37629/g.55265 Transcript_37629/m.55265 type:complete len:93 (-) Transcript_37629:139-417(-)
MPPYTHTTTHKQTRTHTHSCVLSYPLSNLPTVHTHGRVRAGVSVCVAGVACIAQRKASHSQSLVALCMPKSVRVYACQPISHVRENGKVYAV